MNNIKCIVLLITLSLAGCMNPYMGVQTGNQQITVGVANGLTLPTKVPDATVSKLPLKISTAGASRADKKRLSKYFHTKGDWPSVNYSPALIMAIPKSDIASNSGFMIHKLSYDIEKDVSVMDWENPGEELLTIQADLKASATSKYSIYNAGSADTQGFMAKVGDVIKHNHLMLVVQKLDAVRAELDQLAEDYQAYKAMN